MAAAADYWFSSVLRGAICRRLVAGFPVRRTGGGSEDLRSARELLEAGRTVVVFPEGTRSRTGELAPFHSGAIRLAAAAGVPIVPVAIVGTRDVLPVNGWLRPHRVEVRVGRPLFDNEPKQVRASVAALLARRSRL